MKKMDGNLYGARFTINNAKLVNEEFPNPPLHASAWVGCENFWIGDIETGTLVNEVVIEDGQVVFVHSAGEPLVVEPHDTAWFVAL